MTTSGNSRALPVPAQVVRRHQAEIGGEWTLREVGPSLVYEPVQTTTPPRPVSHGEGRDRITEVPLEAMTSVETEEDVAGVYDWSF